MISYGHFQGIYAMVSCNIEGNILEKSKKSLVKIIVLSYRISFSRFFLGFNMDSEFWTQPMCVLRLGDAARREELGN